MTPSTTPSDKGRARRVKTKPRPVEPSPEPVAKPKPVPQPEAFTDFMDAVLQARDSMRLSAPSFSKINDAYLRVMPSSAGQGNHIHIAAPASVFGLAGPGFQKPISASAGGSSPVKDRLFVCETEACRTHQFWSWPGPSTPRCPSCGNESTLIP